MADITDRAKYGMEILREWGRDLAALKEDVPEPELKDALYHIDQARLALNALMERLGSAKT